MNGGVGAVGGGGVLLGVESSEEGYETADGKKNMYTQAALTSCFENRQYLKYFSLQFWTCQLMELWVGVIQLCQAQNIWILTKQGMLKI